MIPTKQVSQDYLKFTNILLKDLDALFALYDTDKSGTLDYKEFS